MVTRLEITNLAAVVAEHDPVSEVYHVIDGAATLVLGPGPDWQAAAAVDRDDACCWGMTGQQRHGGIRNGVAYLIMRLRIAYPSSLAGTGHQFTRIDELRRRIYLIRVDPDKVMLPHTAEDSAADLKTNGQRPSARGGAGAAPKSTDRR